MPRWILFAEVMDKEPTLGAIWSWALVGAAMGFLLCRLCAWLVVVVLPASSLLPVAVFLEIQSFDVGPCIVAEAGYGYVIQSYFALALSVIGPFVGAVICVTRWSNILQQRNRKT